MTGLKDKIVVITGATSGVGAASASAFAAEGCRLVLQGRNPDKMASVVDQCVAKGLVNEQIHTVLGDFGEDSTVTNIVKQTVDTFGGIDVLFNNAGFGSVKDGPPHLGGSVESLDEQYRINMRVPYMLVQQFIPHLAESKGVILFSSTDLSSMNVPPMMSYSATKAGLDQLARTLALSLGPRGIRVNTLNFGIIKSNFHLSYMDATTAQAVRDMYSSGTPLEHKIATTEEIADMAVFLASKKSSCLTGANVICDRGHHLTDKNTDYTSLQ